MRNHKKKQIIKKAQNVCKVPKNYNTRPTLRLWKANLEHVSEHLLISTLRFEHRKPN